MPRRPRSAPETALAAHPPLADRGRMLSADDVLALLPRKADGTPGKSRYWVLNELLPDKKHRLGRTPYWWEADLVKYLDEQGGATAA